MSAKLTFQASVALFVLCGLATGLMTPPAAAEYLRPEWSVGQQGVSASDLEVTVPPPAPEELTIQDAVRLALQHNLGFRRTIRTLLAARSVWRVARQRWYLEVFGRAERVGDDEVIDERQAGVGLSYAALTGADFSVVTELDRLESQDTEKTLTAFLRQPLLAGRGGASAAYEELRQARNTYRAALLSFFVARQGLVESVISSYFETVKQRQLVNIQEFSVELAEEAVRDAQLRLDAGLIPEIDLMRAQLRLSRERAAAVSQRQALQDTIDNQLAFLGLEVGGMPQLVSTVSAEPQDIDLEAAVAQALELRPELRLVDLAIEDQAAALRIGRSNRLPSLDLFGGWSQVTDGAEERSWNVGLDLTVPIASRALDEAVRQAEWGFLVARQEREDLNQQIIADVRAQVRAAEAARANVDIASQSVEVAKRSLHAAQRMVEEGLRTNRDLLDAQDDLTRSDISLVSSKINYYLALVRLRRAVGLDISQDLPTGRAEVRAEEAEQPDYVPAADTE